MNAHLIALDGLRMLDLSRVPAGPWAAAGCARTF